jgi:hypothetical protein
MGGGGFGRGGFGGGMQSSRSDPCSAKQSVRRRLIGTHLLAVGPALALRLALVSSPLVIRRGAELPLRLSDQEFWKLTTDASEPGAISDRRTSPTSLQ